MIQKQKLMTLHRGSDAAKQSVSFGKVYLAKYQSDFERFISKCNLCQKQRKLIKYRLKFIAFLSRVG